MHVLLGRLALGLIAIGVLVVLHRRGRGIVGLAILLAPIAIWAPVALQNDLRGLHDDLRLSGHQALVTLGPSAARGADVPLVLEARRIVPRGATFAIVFGGRFAEARLTGAVRQDRLDGAAWMQWALAPRVAVPLADADWLILRDARPAAIGVKGRRRLQFGSDWLVER